MLNSIRQSAERPARGRCGPPAGQAAFTLIELLIVIGIISLLLGILMPALRGAKMAAFAAKSHARISELSNGAISYWNDNNHYYPGQTTGDVNELNSDTHEGSQILAARLYAYLNTVIDSDVSDVAESKYATYKSDRLFDPGSRPNSLADGFTDKMAILYFPSRIGADGRVTTAFEYDDNSEYITTANAPSNPDTEFRKKIADTRFGLFSGAKIEDPTWPVGANFTAAQYRARNHDSFILIAPGKDRLYFTSDDLENW